MKIAEILYGLKDISRTIDGASLNLEKEVLDAAIEFIEPYAEISGAIEEVSEFSKNMKAKFKSITVDFVIEELDEVAVTEPEETIVTDISYRIDELEGLPQYEINLSGSQEEDERISAYNESLKELANWYGFYKEALEVQQ